MKLQEALLLIEKQSISSLLARDSSVLSVVKSSKDKTMALVRKTNTKDFVIVKIGKKGGLEDVQNTGKDKTKAIAAFKKHS